MEKLPKVANFYHEGIYFESRNDGTKLWRFAFLEDKDIKKMAGVNDRGEPIKIPMVMNESLEVAKWVLLLRHNAEIIIEEQKIPMPEPDEMGVLIEDAKYDLYKTGEEFDLLFEGGSPIEGKATLDEEKFRDNMRTIDRWRYKVHKEKEEYLKPFVIDRKIGQWYRVNLIHCEQFGHLVVLFDELEEDDVLEAGDWGLYALIRGPKPRELFGMPYQEVLNRRHFYVEQLLKERVMDKWLKEHPEAMQCLREGKLLPNPPYGKSAIEGASTLVTPMDLGKYVRKMDREHPSIDLDLDEVKIDA